MKSFKNTQEELDKLPTNTSGLYYFYDDNRLLYVGRARNLKSRITMHEVASDFHREQRFYRRIVQSKGYSSEKDFPELLIEAMRDFGFRVMSKVDYTVIDMIWEKITTIEIEEMPFELAKQKEKKQIKELRPPFNYQTSQFFTFSRRKPTTPNQTWFVF